MLKAAHAYMSTQVNTTSQSDLLIMLYDGAIKFLVQAKDKIEAKDYAGKGILISKAIDVISELDSSLNVEKGGELADNLHKLYFYCNTRLLNANLKMDVSYLDETIRILEGLRDAFDQVAKEGAASVLTPQPAANVPQRPANGHTSSGGLSAPTGHGGGMAGLSGIPGMQRAMASGAVARAAYGVAQGKSAAPDPLGPAMGKPEPQPQQAAPTPQQQPQAQTQAQAQTAPKAPQNADSPASEQKRPEPSTSQETWASKAQAPEAQAQEAAPATPGSPLLSPTAFLQGKRTAGANLYKKMASQSSDG